MKSSEGGEGNKKMKEDEEGGIVAIHARLSLFPDDPLFHKFLAIKREKGLLSWSEVIRSLISAYRLKKEVKVDGDQ